MLIGIFKMKLTHMHHIVPSHMGGSDNKSNLIELSVEEHAEAHRKLYEQHGYWQDYIAWKGLSGRMSKEEIIRLKLSYTHKGKKLTNEHIEILREKGKKLTGSNNPMYGKKQSEKQRKIISEANKGKIVSEETREKIRQANLGKKHKPETIEKNRQWHLGKKLSEKTKRKIQESRCDFKQTDNQKKVVAEKLSKTWHITNPSGVSTTIKNLTQFCKENNLDQGNMSRGKHKGWKCSKLET